MEEATFVFLDMGGARALNSSFPNLLYSAPLPLAFEIPAEPNGVVDSTRLGSEKLWAKSTLVLWKLWSNLPRRLLQS